MLVPTPAGAQSQPVAPGVLTRAVNRVRDQSTPPAPAANKGRDSVLNGILIGAAVGGALGLIPDYFDDCEECHDSLYVSIAVGAGVGLLVDLLRNRGPIDIGVTANRRGVGLRSSIRWQRNPFLSSLRR
jgi:hypothetical protein